MNHSEKVRELIMCGRFTLTSERSILCAHFELTSHFAMKAKFNIAPGHIVAVISQWGMLDFFTWGIVPRWMEKQGQTKPLINARGETVHQKPSFKNDFKQRRCLILADGYYEWKTIQGKKQPFYVRYPDHRPFAFAGIWQGDRCAILTVPAVTHLAKIHERMPVIVKKDYYRCWLEIKKLESLAAFDGIDNDMALQTFPVSTTVNQPLYDDESCIQALHSSI